MVRHVTAIVVDDWVNLNGDKQKLYISKHLLGMARISGPNGAQSEHTILRMCHKSLPDWCTQQLDRKQFKAIFLSQIYALVYIFSSTNIHILFHIIHMHIVLGSLGIAMWSLAIAMEFIGAAPLGVSWSKGILEASVSARLMSQPVGFRRLPFLVSLKSFLKSS